MPGTLSPSPTNQTGPITPTAPMVGGVPQSDLSTNIEATTNAAPELSSQPGTAVSVAASGGNVPLKAQAVTHGLNQQANATAQDIVKQTGGIFGELERGAGSALKQVAHVANVGLATVQQEYRYLHDVEAKHGMMAAVTEGAIIMGAAAAGTALEPGEGTVLGAELAARIEGATMYKDSWKAAANPNYRDPHTHQLVSFGRDVASAVGLQGGERTAVSGTLDALGDLLADPVANVGKGLGAAHSVEGMGGALGKRFTGLAITPESVDNAYRTLPSVKRAFEDIAISSPGDIIRKYPQFAAISGELGAAKTGDEVAQTFRELADTSNMMDAQKLPTLALTRMPFRPLRDAARNAGEGPISNLPYVGDFIGKHLANNALLGPRRWADRLENLPGATFDPATMDFSGAQINPANTRGTTDIYRMMRYSSTDREARSVVDNYVAATPAQRIVIVKNAIFKQLFAMAHVPAPADGDMEDYLTELVDGRTKKAILERLNNHLGAANLEGADPNRVFGTLTNGQVVPPVLDDEGVNVQGAILENQTGNISVPNIVEARRMAQAIRSSRVSRVSAGVDDFLYDHVTQGFFKPLVLMSGGYGLHISLAEAIPNTLRRGLADSASTMYDRAIANLGYRADVEEKKGLLTWLYNTAPHSLRNSQDAQWLTEVYTANEGYKTTTGVAAGEITQGETQPVERAIGGFRQKLAMSTKEGGDFSTFGNEDARFNKMWQAELRENANSRWANAASKTYLETARNGLGETQATEAARQAVVKVLEREPDVTLDNFVRETYVPRGTPNSWTTIDAHAQAIVDKVKGSVHARNLGTGTEAGKLHVDLLQSIANGHTPSIDDLEAIDPSEHPFVIKGRQVIPDGSGMVQRIANVGFRKILNPMVNILSRNQEFASEYLSGRRVLQPMVDAGKMTDEEAMIRAESQATTHVMRFVHNLHDRTQWTATMRNWAPFYFAQEQAYRRMGRLLAEDPGAFRRYQMMISGISNLTANMQDGNGNSYIAFPGSGFIGKGTADIMGMHGIMVGGVTPAAFGGSLSSANVIFPLSQGFKPDLGPVAIVPMQGLTSMFLQLGKSYADFAPVTNVAAGTLNYVDQANVTSDQSIMEQLIPNAFAERLVQLYEAQHGNDRAFNSAVMQTYQYLDYQQAKAVEDWQKGGDKGPAPSIVPPQNASAPVKQAFVEKVRNYVTLLYVSRAITGLVSPVSSNVEITNFGFPQKLNDEITKAGSVNTGMSNFLLKNPDALPWTVSQSYVPSNTDKTQPSGISLSSSIPAETWVANNQAGLNKYGPSFLWLMPQLKDAKYSPTVYNEQIAQGLRTKDTPQQFLNQLYVAAGDNLYYQGLTVHENALAAAGNNSVAKNTEYDAWNAWVAQLGQQYPVWAENYQSGTKAANARDAIRTMTQVFNDNAAPPGEQTTLVKQLFEQYQTAASAYATAGSASSYSTQLSDQSKINDSWIQFLDGLEIQEPSLRPVIQTVFKNALKDQT